MEFSFKWIEKDSKIVIMSAVVILKSNEKKNTTSVFSNFAKKTKPTT